MQLLAQLASKLGWKTYVYQFGGSEGRIDLPNGVVVFLCATLANAAARLAEVKRREDGVVFYSDYHATPHQIEHPSILLQHGVGWDYVTTRLRNPVLKQLNNIRKLVKRGQLLRRIKRICNEVDAVVCVDTNFSNFMQAAYPFTHPKFLRKLNYVPNCSEILARNAVLEKWASEPAKLRCIFPRRFAAIRGALLFANIVREISPALPHVEFCFVGDGECKGEMLSILRGCERVTMYGRPYTEMPQEYAGAHVAVIPTLASEGTSLSCIEAMAGGCAVVTTTVGGLPNLILPGFNGVLCTPTAEELKAGIIGLLNDRGLMKRLALNAHEVAASSFTIRSWQSRMEQILDRVLSNC